MTNDVVLARLRRFLLVIAGLLLAGTILELWVINHTQEAIQWLPFILCGVGLVAVGAALLRPQRPVLIGLRWLMGAVTLGSVFGVIEHIESNLGFVLEIHPDATTGQILAGALGGASPFLAPGMLGLAAVLAVAATYYHPALKSQ
ncbi:MAG: hypothetical protein HY870_02830 [Chloroflexi bacterium]|nr:hypothetical protein [Chloroflexota bacterium]